MARVPVFIILKIGGNLGYFAQSSFNLPFCNGLIYAVNALLHCNLTIRHLLYGVFVTSTIYGGFVVDTPRLCCVDFSEHPQIAVESFVSLQRYLADNLLVKYAIGVNGLLCSSIPGENGFNKWVQERCGKPISLSYPIIRSWLTYGLDKTTAPHRERYIAYQSRQDVICLRCRCYCQLSSSHILLPSLIMKDN